MYIARFAISFINTDTGAAIIDVGTSDKKTAKGAAKNWYNNVGHVIDSWLLININGRTGALGEWLRDRVDWGDCDNIKIIARPIVHRDDAINMNVTISQADKYIEREERFGATVINAADIIL